MKPLVIETWGLRRRVWTTALITHLNVETRAFLREQQCVVAPLRTWRVPAASDGGGVGWGDESSPMSVRVCETRAPLPPVAHRTLCVCMPGCSCVVVSAFMVTSGQNGKHGQFECLSVRLSDHKRKTQPKTVVKLLSPYPCWVLMLVSAWQ